MSPPWDETSVAFANRSQASEMQVVIERGKSLARKEPKADRGRRLQRQRCRRCDVLRTGLAGQAFTDFKCADCGEARSHANTAVPLLCADCAKKRDLCCRCGGEVDAPQAARGGR